MKKMRDVNTSEEKKDEKSSKEREQIGKKLQKNKEKL